MINTPFWIDVLALLCIGFVYYFLLIYHEYDRGLAVMEVYISLNISSNYSSIYVVNTYESGSVCIVLPIHFVAKYKYVGVVHMQYDI